ncbi:MAG: PEP-CTERM system TPR-repeat protein PrsT [Burkholderiaceae bacterium]
MMTLTSPFRLTLLAAALGVALLSGCDKSPDQLVASGQEYLAKGDDKAAIIQFKNALLERPDNGTARLLLGRSLLATGDFAGAEKELRRALELGQPADAVIPPLVQALADQGQVDVVIKEFATRKLDKPEAEAAFKAYLGDALLSRRMQKEAAAAYAAALAAQPGNPHASLGQARLLAIDKQLPAATALVERVVVDAPALGESGLLLSDLRAAQGDRAGARKALEDTVARAPKYLPARLNLIRILLAEGQTEEAGRQLDAARAIQPGDLSLHYFDAFYAYSKGEPQKAAETLEQILKVVPDNVAALVLSARIELQANKTAMAETHLQAALARAPGHVEARRLLAASYLRTGQPAKAQEILQPVLAGAKSADAGLLLLAGEAALAVGNSTQAAGFFKVAAQAPEAQDAGRRAAALTRLGQIQLQSGNVELGLKELEAASALAPDQSQADLAVIANFLSRKEYDKALEAARKLEKRKPDSALSQQVLGNVHLARKELPAARKRFEQALKLDPTYLQAAFALSNMDLIEKNIAPARARYEAIIERDPKKEGAYIGLADLIARSGGAPDEVIRTLQRAISANPNSVAARLALATFHLNRNEAKPAIQVAREALAASPDNPRVLEVLAAAQESAGENNQAIDSLNKLVQVAPRQELALVQLAAAYARQGQHDKAAEQLRRILSLSPKDEGVTRELVVQLVQAKKPDEAMKVARQAQTTFAKSAIGYLLEGEILLTQDKTTEAEAAYRKGLTVQPGNTALAVKLFALLQKTGRAAEADAFASKWVNTWPKDVGMRMALAERDMAGGNLKAAAAQYKTVLGVQPDNVVVLNNLAWVSGELGDPQAIGYAERALKLAPQSPQVIDTLGGLLIKKGDLAQGLEYQARAVQLAPAAPSLRVNYARGLIKAEKKDLARKELEAAQAVPGDSPAKKEAGELLKTL